MLSSPANNTIQTMTNYKLATKGKPLIGNSFTKPINFFCVAPEAKTVAIVGDFNGWNPAVNLMVRSLDGNWMGQIALAHGHHHYWFLVDGQPVLDPRAQGVSRNEKNERVSLMSVS